MFYIKRGKIIGWVVVDTYFSFAALNYENTQIDGYKLSRAVRIAKIAFAFLSQKVRIFYGQNQLSSGNTDTVTLSARVLHSYLRNVCNALGIVFVDKNDPWRSPYVIIFCPLGENASEGATSISENTGIPLEMALSPLETGSREKTRHVILF